MKKTLSLLVLFSLAAMIFLSCSKDLPAGQQESTLSRKLQKALDSGLNKVRGKGISAAVIMPDGWTWTGASGISHGTTKITPQMRFAAGSIGKIFTATTIMQLAEEGGLTLEDSLFKWLPDYPFIDSTITIRQLLNHTSGIFDIADNDNCWQAIFTEPSKLWTPEEFILTFNREAVFPKGTGWNYSTTGYILLRIIIKEITGSKISTNNRDRFWIPYRTQQYIYIHGGRTS
jgi:D-alanyl-D-alanine carboxypeptidase